MVAPTHTSKLQLLFDFLCVATGCETPDGVVVFECATYRGIIRSEAGTDVAAAGLTMRPAELAHAFVGGTGITLAARSRVERLDLARYERST